MLFRSNKEPGVYSARYLGKDTSYEVKNQIILEKLKDVPKGERTARFVCSIAMSRSGEETITTVATLEGYIGDHAEGTNGFGYDPIFFVEGLGTSTAMLSIEEKNKISHRAKALMAMKKELLKVL